MKLPAAVAILLASLSAAALNPFQNPGNLFGDCQSRIDAIYEVVDTPLSQLNPWLKSDSAFKNLVANGCLPSRDQSATKALSVMINRQWDPDLHY